MSSKSLNRGSKSSGSSKNLGSPALGSSGSSSRHLTKHSPSQSREVTDTSKDVWTPQRQLQYESVVAGDFGILNERLNRFSPEQHARLANLLARVCMGNYPMLIKWAITMELQSTKDHNALFQKDSVTKRVVENLSLKESVLYAQSLLETLSPDLTSVSEPSDTERLQRFFTHLMSPTTHCPLPLRHCLCTIQRYYGVDPDTGESVEFSVIADLLASNHKATSSRNNHAPTEQQTVTRLISTMRDFVWGRITEDPHMDKFLAARTQELRIWLRKVTDEADVAEAQKAARSFEAEPTALFKETAKNDFITFLYEMGETNLDFKLPVEKLEELQDLVRTNRYAVKQYDPNGFTTWISDFNDGRSFYKFSMRINGPFPEILRKIQDLIWSDESVKTRAEQRNLSESTTAAEVTYKLPFPYSPCHLLLFVWTQHKLNDGLGVWLWQDQDVVTKAGHNSIRNQFGGINLERTKEDSKQSDLIILVSGHPKPSSYTKVLRQTIFLQTKHIQRICQRLGEQFNQNSSPASKMSKSPSGNRKN